MKFPEMLAQEHVDWYLGSIRQLLIDNFVHGYKHGQDDAFAEVNELEQSAREEYLQGHERRKK